MPKRKNSFARALGDASKRLSKALAERETAQQRLLELNQEIPRLEQIIAVLQPAGEQIKYSELLALYNAATVKPDMAPGKDATPEQLAKWYTEQDLSNLGSVPVEGKPQPVLTEEDTLPNPEGTEVLEK